MIKKISVVIPARNEQETIGPVLSELNATQALLPAYAFETLVVVDSQDDLTVAVAESHGARVVVNAHLRGKGNALYFGFQQASGDVIIILDSDGSHDAKEIPAFIQAIERGAEMVIGSRVLGGSDDHDVVRLFANALFTVMVSMLFGITLMDTLDGYKAFKKEIVMGYTPKAKGFDVEIELVAQAIRQGRVFTEISAHEYRRAGGRMKSHAIRDGFFILKACFSHGIRYRFWRLFHPRAPKARLL